MDDYGQQLTQTFARLTNHVRATLISELPATGEVHGKEHAIAVRLTSGRLNCGM